MTTLIHFILNQEQIQTREPAGLTMLDFIRRRQRLMGTKIGCREGDCGACTVLVGEWAAGGLRYEAMTSCLMPLGNAQGKHIVTIEGLNRDGLNRIQQAIIDRSGTQCGFCTPGFVVSLAGFCLNHHRGGGGDAIAAMDGNICRCTGFKSLERAAVEITENLSSGEHSDPIAWLVDNEFLPDYFKQIPARLAALDDQDFQASRGDQFMGGGTDLFVQRPEEMPNQELTLLTADPVLKRLEEQQGICHIGGAVTVTQLAESALIKGYFPDLAEYMKLISSTPIRNMATVAGNFVNASPIGDLTIFFLALDATLVLSDQDSKREVPLRSFYRGYKDLDKSPAERVEGLHFLIPTGDFFNFEKVSKRTHLDIASVNSAMNLKVERGRIVQAHLSAGGVAPIPLYLDKTSAWLNGRPFNQETAREAGVRAMAEISPISDARGHADYKRLLLRQLVFAHFLKFNPNRIQFEALV